MIKNISQKAHRMEWDSFIKFKDSLVDITTDEIIKLASEHIPTVLKKMEPSLKSLDGRPSLLLDKLGIDFLIEHEGKRYAIDVTTAKRDSIRSKIDKMAERLDFFKALNSTPVIVRSPKGLIPDDIMNLIKVSKFNKGVLDCRLGEDLRLIHLELDNPRS